MLLQLGHAEGTRIAHLTHTTLVVEALCGDEVGFHDEPDLAVICDACLEIAVLQGADVSIWSDRATATEQLPLAA